jgi:hypothetical protein
MQFCFVSLNSACDGNPTCALSVNHPLVGGQQCTEIYQWTLAEDIVALFICLYPLVWSWAQQIRRLPLVKYIFVSVETFWVHCSRAENGALCL